MISDALILLQGYGGHHGVNLLHREHVGKFLLKPGRLQQLGRIFLYIPLQGEETEKGTYPGRKARHSTCRHSRGVDLLYKLMQVGVGGCRRSQAALRQEIEQMRHVYRVSQQRILRQPALQAQVRLEIVLKALVVFYRTQLIHNVKP